MIGKKPNESLTFKLTEIQNGNLSADIDKIIKKEQSEKLESAKTLKNKQELGY